MPRNRRSRDESDDPLLPNLAVPKDEAERRLQERIDLGKQLADKFRGHSTAAKVLFGSPDATLQDLKNENRKWNDFNIDLLKRLFDNSTVSREYAYDISIQPGRGEIDSIRTNLNKKILHLESLVQRLSLYQESRHVHAQPQPKRGPVILSNEVFLVHGQNVAAKEQTARFLEKLGLKVVILHEQPNKSRALIEKFEDYSSAVGFAVVLLTPDDVGGPIQATSEQPKPQSLRARQNVIFELGYFFGKLGREKVCALYAQGVELPSDMHGIVYVPLDERGAWRLALAKELKTAGFDIDMNKVI